MIVSPMLQAVIVCHLEDASVGQMAMLTMQIVTMVAVR